MEKSGDNRRDYRHRVVARESCSDRAFRHRTSVIRTAKSSTSGAMVRTAPLTLASTHPAALAVHSGIVADTPRAEGSRGVSGQRVTTGTLTLCCSGTATGGPNSNDPLFLRRRLATSSASVWPPRNPLSKAMSASAPDSRGLSNQLAPETRWPTEDRPLGLRCAP